MTEPRVYELTVEGIPPGPNSRMHWAQKNRLTAPIRDAVAWQAKAVAPRVPLQRAHVAITLFRTTGRTMDFDNSISCCKAYVDGVVQGRLLADDSMKHITLEVMQERGSKRGAKIVVTEVA